MSDNEGNIITGITQFQYNKADIHNNVQHYTGTFTYTANGVKYKAFYQDILENDWHFVYAVPMDSFTQDYRDAIVRFLLVFTVAILVILSIIYLILKNVTHRVGELADCIKEVEDGNFDVSIKEHGNDEISTLSHSFNSMTKRLDTLIHQVSNNKIREKEYDMQSLQSQLNPHFLYNTLSAISWMSISAGNKDISTLALTLAKFYRLSLNKGKKTITVNEEIMHSKAYIDIMSIRYRERISIEYVIEDEVLELLTLNLILQPFLENILLHGMDNIKRSVHIILDVKKSNDCIIFTITDNGVGMHESIVEELILIDSKESKGYGVKNVNKRIKLFYDDEYGIFIDSEINVGTTVTIKVPIIS